VTIYTSEQATARKQSARTVATSGAHRPTLLADTELDRVVAAGSKPGVSGGQIPLPPRPKP
jgi:hypothetical protein